MARQHSAVSAQCRKTQSAQCRKTQGARDAMRIVTQPLKDTTQCTSGTTHRERTCLKRLVKKLITIVFSKICVTDAVTQRYFVTCQFRKR